MKIFLTFILLIIFGVSVSLGLDTYAVSMQDEALDRAMIAFGLAKGLNAVISLIQGTEISFAPAGLGLNFSVGEVLDPFNDMVERFSWVMLLATVSLGIQKIILLLSSKLFLQVAIAMSIGISLGLLWIKKIENYNLLMVSLKLFIILILLRFSAVFFVYTSELFYNSILAQEYNSAKAVITDTKGKLEDLNSKSKEIVVSKEKQGFINSLYTSSSNLIDSLNISEKLKSLEKDIEAASRNIINLITIFLIQSVITPLLFLWILVLSIKVVYRAEFKHSMFRYNK